MQKQHLFFTKKFITGNLAGSSVDCHMIDYDGSMMNYYKKFWRTGKKGKDILTNSTWIITRISGQCYNRKMKIRKEQHV